MARSTPVARDTVLTYQTAKGVSETIVIGSSDWYDWLGDATHRYFAFHGRAGRFTARKERKQRGGWYWTAYRQVAGKLYKAYLGKSADLTLARLNNVAVELARDRSVSDDISTQAKHSVPASLAPSISPLPHILATKLHIPQIRLDLVPRPELVERLDARLTGRLTLVAAPAGFGKTTLLSEWLKRTNRRAAWLSLDEGDNDTVVFLRYLVAALQTVVPSVGETALQLLRSPQPPPLPTLLATLINDLATLHESCILVLDDYHVLREQAVHQTITFLLEHQPPQLHLAIVTREDPPLPLARLRARRQLNELRAADLRFTTIEATEFLNEIMGLDLDASTVARLEERTEGWITGLHLAALALQDRSDTASFIAAFTGSHHFVVDYLAEEVLSRLPEPVQAFLLHTSILNCLCGPLCDAVLEAQQSQNTLHQIEHANLFLFPLDAERQWYRYHPLFANLLHRRLRQLEPDLERQLHLRASRWFEAAGLFAEAIRHSLTAQDFSQAARLIEERVESVLKWGEATTLRGWLDALPTELVRDRLRLCLALAWASLMMGNAEVGERLLQDVERRLGDGADNDVGGLLGEVLAFQAQVATTQRNAPRTLELARRALDLLSSDKLMLRGRMTASLGWASYWLTGDVVAASRCLVEASAISQEAGSSHAVVAMFGLGELQALQGQLQLAAQTYRQALDLAARRHPGLPYMGLAFIGLAEVEREWNSLDKALQYAREGMRIGTQGQSMAVLDLAYPTLARVYQARGDVATAGEVVLEAEGFASQVNVAYLITQMRLHRARLAVAQGDVEGAARWLHECGLRVDDDLSPLREFDHITLARVLIALGRQDRTGRKLRDAMRLLDRLLCAAETGGRIASMIEILTLRCLALEIHGDRGGAVPVLKQALRLAEPQGYIRTFVDEGAPMAELLRRLETGEGRLHSYTKTLLAAFPYTDLPAPSQSPIPNPQSTLIEPLTEREREVLRLVAAGQTNAEIANTLVVAMPTVKRHISNIYGKLGVQTRTQAVAQARELGLV